MPAAVNIATDNDKAKARVGSSIVKDEATGDYIVKLVNMLPVAANVNLDLVPLGVTAAKVMAEQLAGDPAATDTAVKKVEISLPEAVLPPYSFTVIRLSSKAR